MCGGVVSFFNTLSYLVDHLKPRGVIVAWESGGSPRRRKIFPDYKSQRRPQKLNRFYQDDIPDSVENRSWQIQTTISVCKSLPVCQIYAKDAEADDVIGYVSRYFFLDSPKVIVSSDKDFYQLLGDTVKMWSPHKKNFITQDDVIKNFGVHPRNFAVAKSFCGDVSDNIPGLDRVGFKTLSKKFPELLQPTAVTVEDITQRSKELLAEAGKKPPKFFQSIAEGYEVAHRNWQLVDLDTQSLKQDNINKIRHAIEGFEPDRNKMNVMRLVVKFGIASLDIDRLFLSFNNIRGKLTQNDAGHQG